jgi:acyl-CoA oxidase
VTSTLPPRVDPKALQEVLDGRWAHVRRDARENLVHEPEFLPVYGESLQEARERVTRMAKALADSGRVGLGFPKDYGGEADAGGSVTSIEMLAFGDLSLMVKAGVQWGLFGGAVQLLGTKRHHDAYLRDIICFDLPGCFAMTETGHGSDVQQLRTTCTYDPETQTFDLHTPHEAARKDYIGNAAKDGRMAVVFAQLITQGTNHGVHAWLVPIRDEKGNPMPGVTIGDDGPKAGLLGVDNGRLTFDHMQVPREMLLDRYGQVAEDGTYTSSIGNETRRFFTMLGTLVRGRVSVGGAAGSATKLALDIAVRYGNVRRQFAAPGKDREIVINDYLVHQRKLLPALATTYALHFAQGELVETMHDVQTAVHEHGQELDEAAQRELESRAAGLKVAQTAHATRTIQMCREACGGAGYLQENRLPHLKADTDVFTTSRATTRSCCSWSPRACSPATATRSARSTAGARSASSPTWSARPCWSGRRPAASSSGSSTPSPAGTTTCPCSTAAGSSRPSRTARSTPSRAPSADCARTRPPTAWSRSTCSTPSRTTC